MANLLRFLTQFQFLFYIVLAVVIIVYVRRVIRSYRLWKLAYFGVEKELAQTEYNQNLAILIISVVMVVGLFVLTVIVAPSVPGVNALSTPTVNLTVQASDTPIITPAAESTTTGLIATLQAAYGQGCVPDQINWTYPRSGDTINGTVTLKGTVNVPSLGYYKYEFSPVGNESWTTIAAGDQPVNNDALGGSWDTGNLTPGDYVLRLVVTDAKNEEYTPCIIQIKITAPPQ